MNKLKLIVAGIVVLITLVACGEGFKAKNVLSESEADKIADRIKESIPNGITPPSVDQDIQKTYRHQTQYMNQDLIDAVDKSIKAFEASFDIVEHPGGASEAAFLKIRLQTGCQNNHIFEMKNSSTKMSDLQSLKKIYVGRVDKYSSYIQCTAANCQELVASLIVNDSSISPYPMMVLIGLQKSGTSIVGNTTTTKFVRRHVSVSNFINVLSFAEYNLYICKDNIVRTSPTTPQAPQAQSGYTSQQFNNNSGTSSTTAKQVMTSPYNYSSSSASAPAKTVVNPIGGSSSESIKWSTPYVGPQ